MIKMILATDTQGALGLKDSLPWHCPEDLQYFKEQTVESTVIMGSTTFRSLPFTDGLPNRRNFILTRRTPPRFFQRPQLAWPTNPNNMDCKSRFLSPDSLSEFLAPYQHVNAPDIWVIGGKSIYESLLHYVDEIHHTMLLDKEYEADTFIDTEWEEVGFERLDAVRLSDRATVNIYRRV